MPFIVQKLIYKTNFMRTKINTLVRVKVKVKIKQSRNRPGVSQRVPGGIGSQIP
jgi:hypothetical protein